MGSVEIDPVEVLSAGVASLDARAVRVQRIEGRGEQFAVEISFEGFIARNRTRKTNVVVRSNFCDSVMAAKKDGTFKMMQKLRDHYDIRIGDFSFICLARKRRLFDRVHRKLAVINDAFVRMVVESEAIISLVKQWCQYLRGEECRHDKDIEEVCLDASEELESIICGPEQAVSHARSMMNHLEDYCWGGGGEEITRLRTNFVNPMMYDRDLTHNVIVRIVNAIAAICGDGNVSVEYLNEAAPNICQVRIKFCDADILGRSSGVGSTEEAERQAYFNVLEHIRDDAGYSINDAYHDWLAQVGVYFAIFDAETSATISVFHAVAIQMMNMFNAISRLNGKIRAMSDGVEVAKELSEEFLDALDHMTDHCYSVMKNCKDVILGKETFAELAQKVDQETE